MVTEFRQIVFPMPVLRQALDAAQFGNGLACYGLPAGAIVGVELHEAVTLLLDPLDGGEQVRWTLNASEIGTALIRWCIEHRVPLPKAGDKRLSSIGGHLCLEIYLPGGVDPLPPEVLGAGLPFAADAPESRFAE